MEKLDLSCFAHELFICIKLVLTNKDYKVLLLVITMNNTMIIIL